MDEQSSASRCANRCRGQHTAPTPSTRRQGGPFNPAVLGRAAHELIAELAAAGLSAPDFERVSRAVRAHPATRQPTVPRQAARQWLCSATSMYFRLFALPAGWELLGAEVSGPTSRFDLVWRNRFRGDVLADELKTGKAGDLVGGAALEEQLQRQRRDGAALYHEQFIGIRLLVLAAPRRSFFLAADGVRSPLYEVASA